MVPCVEHPGLERMKKAASGGPEDNAGDPQHLVLVGSFGIHKLYVPLQNSCRWSGRMIKYHHCFAQICYAVAILSMSGFTLQWVIKGHRLSGYFQDIFFTWLEGNFSFCHFYDWLLWAVVVNGYSLFSKLKKKTKNKTENTTWKELSLTRGNNCLTLLSLLILPVGVLPSDLSQLVGRDFFSWVST